MAKKQKKYDPFEIVDHAECNTCTEVRDLTIVECGDELCKECCAKFYGYILKGYKKEHKYWKKEVVPTLNQD